MIGFSQTKDNESDLNRDHVLQVRWLSAFSESTLECDPRFMSPVASSEKKTPVKRMALRTRAKAAGMLIGYARVSTQDQNLELQTEALQGVSRKHYLYIRESGGTDAGSG